VGSPLRIRCASIALAALSLVTIATALAADRGRPRAGRQTAKVWPHMAYPSARALRSAERFAADRGGVAFALIDGSVGLRGYDPDRTFSSASVSKALLVAAELRRLGREGLPLDQETRALLEPMVTYSDNRSADAIYARVGDQGLQEVAERAGMRSFQTVPGYWGGDRITAADMARFFYRLEANLPGPHRRYAMGLLSRITSAESWGIPEAIGHGWMIWFKGGWRPPGEKENSGPVTHQAALLVHRRGERVALAVLTDEPPGGASFAIIGGIAERLLGSTPPHRGGWTAP
jgi:beta-lactamase family protein